MLFLSLILNCRVNFDFGSGLSRVNRNLLFVLRHVLGFVANEISEQITVDSTWTLLTSLVLDHIPKTAEDILLESVLAYVSTGDLQCLREVVFHHRFGLHLSVELLGSKWNVIVVVFKADWRRLSQRSIPSGGIR